jgi:chemotaxis protein methyltransferase CheR
MHITDFDLYADLLKKQSGLTLSSDKSYLIDSRLGPVAKAWGFDSLSNMTNALRGLPDPKLIKDIVEAMTTNETSFYRDTRPFEIFKNVVMPYMLKSRASSKRLKIWCAAASSGQEPYSIAMMLKDMAHQMPKWKIEIYATDIDDKILDQASAAKYSQFEVQRGLPVQTLIKYFDEDGDKWALKDEIRNMVKFANFNLLNSMAGMDTFDVVFCRNVLIYFDAPDKTDILQRISQKVTGDGFLFLGGAETVFGLTDTFKPLPNHRGLYILSEGQYDMEQLA